MSSPDPSPTDEDEERPPADGTSIEEIREAVDAMGTDEPGSPTDKAPAARAIRDQLRERIEEALGDVAYVQHAYATREHDVCRVGIREEGEIREELAIVGPGGVARLREVQARVDHLRRGGDPSYLGGLVSDE